MDRIPRKGWAGWTKAVALISLMLFMTACTGFGLGGGSVGNLNVTGKLADKVTPVAVEYRAVRVCLMAAGIVEVMTDRIQMFDGASAPAAIGRLQSLQGAIDTARTADTMWSNTDMTDVSIQFARVLKDAGREKLGRILLGGPTIRNALNIAKRAMLLTSKGEAVLLDINAMLTGLSAGTYTEEKIWAACDGRIMKNRRVLSILSGIPTQ